MVNPYRNLLPATVGFDRLFSTLDELNEVFETKKPTYPPYNIYKLDNEDEYYIEMAVAGFDEDEIDVTLDGKTLWVEGVKHEQEQDTKYLYHGLASRNFKHKYILNEYTGVEYVLLEKGILTIKLVNLIPEEKKPMKLAINSKSPKVLEK